MTDTATRAEARPVPPTDNADDAVDDAVDALAERLRNAGAWLKLAGERLEHGQLTDAAGMVGLGLFLAEGIGDAIQTLADERDTTTEARGVRAAEDGANTA